MKKTFVFYLHPCSTSVLVYIIPKEFDEILKNDLKFKIGFYGTPFNEYLNKVYNGETHKDSVSYMKPYIRTVMECEIEENDLYDEIYKPMIKGSSEWILNPDSKGEKRIIKDTEMYYYEMTGYSLDGPGEWERFLTRNNLLKFNDSSNFLI